MKLLVTIPFLMTLSICSSPPPTNDRGALRPVDPRIEICSAGSAVSISANAGADLTEVLKGQGSVNATVERKVETMISQAANNTLTGEQLVSAQENYLACLKDEAERTTRNAKPWQSYSAKQCKAYAMCEESRMAKVRICREEFQRAGQPSGECSDNLTQRLAGCFEVGNSDELELARSFCEVNYN